MRVRMIVAYDGSGFSGWQKQPDRITVQESLQDALVRLFSAPVHITGAGRTDAGVHASGQVVHFDLPASSTIPPERIRFALSRFLPDGISVLASEEAAPDFHACFGALSRHYRYRFVFPPLYPWEQRYRGVFPYEYDSERVLDVFSPLLGRQDFTSFSLKDCDARTRIREMREIRIEENRGGFDLLFTADGFLRRMIRMITGTFLEVYPDASPVFRMREVLAACDNSFSGPPAPPGGLYLERVDYR